jgi:RAB protein geranylgeranyltransferase component A
MKDVLANKIVNLKKISRDIVKEIISFGVTEDQKIDIIYLISLELDNHNATKDIANIIKKYLTTINNEEKVNNIKESKILLT